MTPNLSQMKKERDGLYDRVWCAIGKHVGYGIACDTLTDTVLHTILDHLPQPGQRPVHPQWDACLTAIRKQLGE